MNINSIYVKFKLSRPILGVISIVISPVYVPIICMWHSRKDVKQYFNDSKNALLMRDIDD